MKNEKKSISRADVARLCIASLTESGGKSVSFDCIGRELAEGEEGTAVKSAEETLKAFIDSGVTCDYTLGPSGM